MPSYPACSSSSLPQVPEPAPWEVLARLQPGPFPRPQLASDCVTDSSKAASHCAAGLSPASWITDPPASASCEARATEAQHGSWAQSWGAAWASLALTHTGTGVTVSTAGRAGPVWCCPQDRRLPDRPWLSPRDGAVCGVSRLWGSSSQGHKATQGFKGADITLATQEAGGGQQHFEFKSHPAECLVRYRRPRFHPGCCTKGQVCASPWRTSCPQPDWKPLQLGVHRVTWVGGRKDPHITPMCHTSIPLLLVFFPPNKIPV